MHRTTIMLDETLYRHIKRTAVDRGRSMRMLVEDALRKQFGFSRRPPKGKVPSFGVYNARIVGSLRRADIYEEHLKHKMGG